ncbi:hypothetical protein [Persicobacter sp. CCB-QB2]|uniref:hypothetical protein n=1 Tax=Persicobacter sp. CCB-QB2 TaxID=1561025 RepID=UPI0009E4D3A6|nr:hypothetical protein [Persicobacter sp. CCB-QB2]
MTKKSKRFVLHDQSKNSYGLILQTSGGDLTQFKKNPVMLHEHNGWMMPIGHWDDIQVEGEKITAVPVFDLKDEFAKVIAQKVEDGHIRMASMGVLPLEVDGDVVTKWEVREASIVTFGSNKNALRLMDANGELLTLSAVKNLKPSGKSNNQKNSMEFKETIATAINLSASSEPAQVLAKVLELSQENISLKAENARLKEEKEAAQKSAETKEKEEILLSAVTSKKITVEQKKIYEKLELSEVKTLVGDLKKPLNLSEFPEPGGEEVQLPKQLEGMTFSEISRKNPQALEQLKLSNKEAYKKLFKDQYGKEPTNF